MKNIKINILVSFICLLFTNSLFAQVNSHERMIKKMRERGLSEKEIENEISEMNTFYQKTLYQEYKRSQDEINKKYQHRLLLKA